MQEIVGNFYVEAEACMWRVWVFDTSWEFSNFDEVQDLSDGSFLGCCFPLRDAYSTASSPPVRFNACEIEL